MRAEQTEKQTPKPQTAQRPAERASVQKTSTKRGEDFAAAAERLSPNEGPPHGHPLVPARSAEASRAGASVQRKQERQIHRSGAPAATERFAGYKVHGQTYGVTLQDDGDHKVDPRNFGRIQGAGVGVGNRPEDLLQPVDPNQPGGEQVRKNAPLTHANLKVPKAVLDKVAVTSSHKAEYGGFFAKAEERKGSAHGKNLDASAKRRDGANEVSGPGYFAQGGVSQAAEAGYQKEHKGKAGSASVGGKVGADLEVAGTSAASLNHEGLGIENTASVGVGVLANVNAGVKSKGLKVKGVEKDLDLGVGVSGDAAAYMRAGGTANLNVKKNNLGVELKGGAAIAAELKGEAKANVGPLGAKADASLMAGAGLGGDATFAYKDGKLIVGARFYAICGIGGGAGAQVEIDVKQSAELAASVLKKARDAGVQGAQAAFRTADADHDGKLTLMDAAHHSVGAMDKVATGVDKGADKLIGALDGDGDGKFDARKDMGARLEQAKDKGSELLQAGGDKLSAMGQSVVGAGKSVVAKGTELAGKAHDALDRDGDGAITGNDALTGMDQVGQFAEKKLGEAAEWADEKKEDLAELGEDLKEKAEQGLDDLHDAADRNDDGKVDLADVKQGAGELAQKGQAIVEKGVEKVGEVGSKVVGKGKEKLDQAIDYGKAKGQALVNGVKDAGSAAHKAADRNGDGKLDTSDIKAGIEQAGAALEQKVAESKEQLVQRYEQAKTEVTQLAQKVYDQADLNKDGKVDGKDLALGKKKVEQKLAQTRKQGAKYLEQQKQKAKNYGKKKIEQGRKVVKRTVQKGVQTFNKTVQKGQRFINRQVQRANNVKRQVHKKLDRDGNGRLGFNDVKQGGRQLINKGRKTLNRAGNYAKKQYNRGVATVKKAQATINAGYQKTKQRVGASIRKVGKFLGF